MVTRTEKRLVGTHTVMQYGDTTVERLVGTHTVMQYGDTK